MLNEEALKDLIDKTMSPQMDINRQYYGASLLTIMLLNSISNELKRANDMNTKADKQDSPIVARGTSKEQWP